MLTRLGANGWRAEHWRLLRLALGTYLAVHFALLLPWAAELFSSAGMVADAHASPLFGLLPSPLELADTPWMAVGLVAAGMLAGVAMVLDRGARPAAVVGWYVLAVLLARNPLILNPALPTVGWTLLWFAAVPSPKGARWRLPPELFAAAWLLGGLSLTWSAATKLGSMSWLDGTALIWLWDNPLARDTALRAALTRAPELPVRLLSWGALLLEAAALPAALAPRLRRVVWPCVLALHLGVLLTVDFADLTVGMLVCHLALFDPAWLRGRLAPCSASSPSTTTPACST